MAAARNNLTRRAVLGAAFAAPAVLGRAAKAELPRREFRGPWDRALTSLRQAEAAEEAFRVRHMHPADQAYHAIRGRWPIDYDFSRNPEARAEVQAALAAYEPLEDRLNDLHCAHLEAIKRLLRVPAPDLPALAAKIELAADYEVWELEGGEQCMAALKADATRLAGIGEGVTRRLW